MLHYILSMISFFSTLAMFYWCSFLLFLHIKNYCWLLLSQHHGEVQWLKGGIMTYHLKLLG
uniref:Uncharacterized protein n=1 Tax=Rhizophora mucronata TaxID=61149 RepID=A0A2P2QCR1_RHIMU